MRVQHAALDSSTTEPPGTRHSGRPQPPAQQASSTDLDAALARVTART